MQMNRTLFLYISLMTLIVVASNVLVQYPLWGTFLGISLGDLLTFGAFTYPVAFLITDLTNRQYGPARARIVVAAGFVVGVTLSWFASEPRIAIASGSAFLAGQLLDIAVFNRLRAQTWWRAPLFASLLGSLLDTVLFFSLAFSSTFSLVWPDDAFAVEAAPVLGVISIMAPRWISWALGDFGVKILVGLVMLLPYGALMNVIRPMTTGSLKNPQAESHPAALKNSLSGGAHQG